VLDAGAGAGEHSKIFRFAGKAVTSLDPIFRADVHMDIFDYYPGRQFDLVFCSHVLEHQRNIGIFLDKLIGLTKEGGLISISVPPELNPHVLLCHPNQFSAGLLIYHLVMAGIDCRDAQLCTYGYNLSVIVRNIRNSLSIRTWAHEEEAAEFMPQPFRDFCVTSFNRKTIFGPMRNWNWTPVLNVAPHVNSKLQG
jgi:SAM-dependent methyltransferase